MKIKIEEAKRKDLNLILKFHMDLSDYHWNIDQKYYRSGKERKKYLKSGLNKFFLKKRKNRKIFVAKVGNKIVGLLGAMIYKSHSLCRERKIGEIGRMYIEEKFRRKRIGELLVKEALNWFLKRKIKFIEVVVDCRNTIGISAYRKYGFFEFLKIMRLGL